MEPDDALTDLTLATFVAFDYGAQGRIARGYLILTTGLARARAISSEGADQIIERWELVLAQFRRRFPCDGYFDHP
jgi:hypothetical protein